MLDGARARPRGLRGLPIRVAAASLTLLLLAMPAWPDPGEDLSQRVRAAYVYKFLNFVEWPEASSSPSSSGGVGRLAVCVLGADGLEASLGALDGRLLGERRIEVRALHRTVLADDCAVLVTDARGDAARVLLERVGGSPMLTIGETGSFLRQGGVIAFVGVEDTVRFEVNLDAARRAGLEVSSHLLRFAERVHSTREAP